MTTIDTTSVKDALKTAKDQLNVKNIVFWISTIVFAVLSIVGFTRISSVIGSREDINTLKPKLAEILTYIFVATFAFCIAVFMYFAQDNTKAIYFSIIVSCFSFGMAYAALVISSITR